MYFFHVNSFVSQKTESLVLRSRTGIFILGVTFIIEAIFFMLEQSEHLVGMYHYYPHHLPIRLLQVYAKFVIVVFNYCFYNARSHATIYAGIVPHRNTERGSYFIRDQEPVLLCYCKAKKLVFSLFDSYMIYFMCTPSCVRIGVITIEK